MRVKNSLFFQYLFAVGESRTQADWMFKPLLSQQGNNRTCYCMSLTWQQQGFFLLCLCHCFCAVGGSGVGVSAVLCAVILMRLDTIPKISSETAAIFLEP